MSSPQPDYKTVNRTTYNRIAASYIENDKKTIPETSVVHALISHFITLLPPHATLLDVGIGGGRDARLFAAAGISVTGIDTSQDLLTQGAALDRTKKITYLLMDFEEIDFPAHTFDGVWANASLHHIPKANLPTVLQRIRTVLKPDGYFQIKVHHGTGEGFKTDNKFGHSVTRYFANYEPEELSALLQEAGFAVCEHALTTGGKWLDILAQKAGK